MNVSIEEIACHDCGILYGLPKHFFDCRKVDNKIFYCPNGHKCQFLNGKEFKNLTDENIKLTTENENLRRQIVALTARIDQLEAASSED